MARKKIHKGETHTSDYLPWDAMTDLIRQLFDDGYITMALLIGVGSCVGLRVSDLKTLTWNNLLHKRGIDLFEIKTGKRRIIAISPETRAFIEECRSALRVTDLSRPAFLNRFGSVYTTQGINKNLRAIRNRYSDLVPELAEVQHFSSHSLRKTFGRHVYESAADKSAALATLSDIFNHSSEKTTRRYLGFRQDDFDRIYMGLKL